MGACELRWERRRGVPEAELRFERRDVGDDILISDLYSRIERSVVVVGKTNFDLRVEENASNALVKCLQR